MLTGWWERVVVLIRFVGVGFGKSLERRAFGVLFLRVIPNFGCSAMVTHDYDLLKPRYLGSSVLVYFNNVGLWPTIVHLLFGDSYRIDDKFSNLLIRGIRTGGILLYNVGREEW